MASRFGDKLAQVRREQTDKRSADVSAEIVKLNNEPHNDSIPADVWAVMQENGRIATERLNELLTSTRFHRLKAGEQAKLIALAQDRAYGRADPGIKRVVKATANRSDMDATSAALARLSSRASLPEYRNASDAEIIPSDPPDDD